MSEDELFDDLYSGFKASKKFADPLWTKRNHAFDLYIGTRPKPVYESEANFHLPYVATLLDNVFPLLVNRSPFPSVSARNPSSKDSAKLMQELLVYTYDVNGFNTTFMDWVKEAMFYGTSWLKVEWAWNKKETDHPTIKKPDTMTVTVHPRKVRLDDRWPIYQYSEMTKSEMRDMGWSKRVINSLGDSKLKSQSYRTERLHSLGINPDTFKDKSGKQIDDLYEVVECECKRDLSPNGDGEEKMYSFVMVNGEKFVNTKPFPGKDKFETPYDHKLSSFIPLHYNKLTGMFYGESFIDPIVPLQEELNALMNMQIDNYVRRNNPPLEVEDGVVDLELLQYVQSAPWVVKEMGKIREVIVADLGPSIEARMNQIKSEMQNRVGANDVLLVSNTTAIKGGNTATGAAIANENTKIRFLPTAKNIDEALTRLGELCIALYQQDTLFDRAKAIAIADEEGEFNEQKIEGKDVKGNLKFRTEIGSTLAESKETKLQKAIMIKQMYAQDQTKDQVELDREVFNAAGYDFDKIQAKKDTQLPELALKLKQLVALTKRPGFEQQPPEKRQQVFEAIMKIRTMLASSQGEEIPVQDEQPVGEQ